MTKTRTFSIHCFDRANGNYFHTSCIYLRAPSIRPLWVVRSYVVRRFPELVSLHVYRGWLLCYYWRGCSALCNINIAKKSSFVIHSFACLLTTNATLSEAMDEMKSQGDFMSLPVAAIVSSGLMLKQPSPGQILILVRTLRRLFEHQTKEYRAPH